MTFEGGLIPGDDESACRYNRKGFAIRKDQVTKKARKNTPPVKSGSGTSGAPAKKEKNTKSKQDKETMGTPFPRWMFPGGKIDYPFIPDGDCLYWPSSPERQRTIMESTVLPLVPLALRHYNNQDDFEYVRMLDICAIDYHGTVVNFKFEAKPVGSEGGSKVFFAQIHFHEDDSDDDDDDSDDDDDDDSYTKEEGHVNQCCLYEAHMPDITHIHADCLVCFPDPPEGYQHSGAGKYATAVLNRVVRVSRTLPVGKPPYACYFLTKQEEKELLRYYAVELAKLALDDFKTKATNDEDAGLEFVQVVKARCFTPPMMVFNIKFEVKRMNSVELFVAQVHRNGALYDINRDAHVSICAPYDPNDIGRFPPSCAVCSPRELKDKHRYTEM